LIDTYQYTLVVLDRYLPVYFSCPW